MYSEAEYEALKALKHRSLVEESRWQTVREERRRVLNNAAKRNKRTGYTEEQKISERERNREQRAKMTEEEAAAATRKNTERRQLVRAMAAEGKAQKMLIVEISESNEVISKRSVPIDEDKDAAPLLKLVHDGAELGLLAGVLPAEPGQVRVQQGGQLREEDPSPPLASPHNYSMVMNGADSRDTEEMDSVMYTFDTSTDNCLNANFSTIEAAVKDCEENFNSQEFY